MAHLLDLVNVAAALADLVHDVPYVVGEPLVLPAHLLQRGETFRVPVAHAEQLAGCCAAIALNKGRVSQNARRRQRGNCAK
jgi:hypothetical protein